MSADLMVANYLLFLLAIHVIALAVIGLLMLLVKPWVLKRWPTQEHRKAREHLINGIAIGYGLALVIGWFGRALAPLISPG
ncbi:MAG: hypothetical protein GVY11_03125 [Gammaproteobacteria bacterium]|nr:hypothetical protein [Gammaproteobacteria bacterium]